MKKKRTLGRFLTALASAGGIVTSLYLVQVHIEVKTIGSSGGALCDLGEGFGCEAAALSGWSEIFGIPIAAIGFAFYVAAFISLLAFGRKASVTNPVALPSLLATLFLLSLLYSVVLGTVSVTLLGSICPMCFLLYSMNLLGFIGVWLWRDTPPWSALATQARKAGELVKARDLLVVVGLGAIALAGTMIHVGMEVRSHTEQQRLLDASRRDAPPADDSLLRVDYAPAKGADEDATVVIVEFSNYACPWCARLSETFEAVLPEFAEQVRLELRPLPRAEQPASMEAARAAYCANEQGAFETLHPLLYREISGLTRERVLALAARAGLSADPFATCMRGDTVDEYIRQDRAAASALGVSGTPTFFINGVRQDGFVEADELRRLLRRAIREGQAE